jgi:SAM-dependent methyltransferase
MNVSSFRDPAGNVALVDGRVFRTVSEPGAVTYRRFANSPATKRLFGADKIVKTIDLARTGFSSTELPPAIASALEIGGLVLEHERVWFPSYPYEWPAEMLFEAGLLTIELADACLEDGFGLKDATPYNVLFHGAKPVFIDVLSFEERNAGDPRWVAYGQFIRTFVLPLLMNRDFGVTLAETFLSHRDGIEPENAYKSTTWAKRVRSPYLTTVAIPSWLSSRVAPGEKKLYKPEKSMPVDKAEFVLRMRLRAARKLLRKVRPPQSSRSNWSSYTKTLSYGADEYTYKKQTVEEWLARTQSASVLDVGCNTGEFSQIAAETGARVVAIDTDPVVVGNTFSRAKEARLDILPLVVNLAWPTPAIGWRNREYPSFLDRAEGRFETVMMLAVLHHLLVTERVPLTQIVEVASRLTRRNLIIEFVSKDDEMFGALLRGRESLHADFTQQVFETAFRQQFDVVEKRPVKGNLRWLYLLQRKHG